MRSLPANIWRNVALPLALVICTSASPLPVFIGNDSSIDDSPVSDNDQIQQLVRILSGAYENSLMHDGSKADLEASDVLLETASIRFSSRALAELKNGSCRSEAQPSAAANACALADPSLALSEWAEMLSHAAYRLDSLARSAPAADSSDNSRAVVAERMESMEH